MKPSLDRCLAYCVISDYSAWLGERSIKYLEMTLIGAQTRAQLTRAEIPEWRIFGPLEQAHCYMPIVARTGHPKLTIKWSTALQMIHFKQEDAFSELRQILEDWARSPDKPSMSPFIWSDRMNRDLLWHLRAVASRPGMFLCSDEGWALRCFLNGMARGGDWLSLPNLPGLREVIDGIETRSNECYGSAFAAYRVYNATGLLAWVDIHPVSKEDLEAHQLLFRIQHPEC